MSFTNSSNAFSQQNFKQWTTGCHGQLVALTVPRILSASIEMVSLKLFITKGPAGVSDTSGTRSTINLTSKLEQMRDFIRKEPCKTITFGGKIFIAHRVGLRCYQAIHCFEQLNWIRV